VADVMGKGVPAALFAATLRTLVRTLAEWTPRPGELLARINRLMYQELSSVDMFITVQLALADMRQHRLMIASAGHCPLLLANCQGEPSAISPEGMPLGILPEAVFAEETASIEPSGCALLYTDGLTDARNPDGDLFGQARLEDWLCRNVKPSQTADRLKEDFLAELSRFRAQASAIDDLTFLILAGEGPDRPQE
jgi:sigma-B regulation protein RsbU (phosphoserine phosphatase)